MMILEYTGKCCVVYFLFTVFFLLYSATTTRREVFVWKFNPYGCVSALMFDAAIYSVTYSEYSISLSLSLSLYVYK